MQMGTFSEPYIEVRRLESCRERTGGEQHEYTNDVVKNLLANDCNHLEGLCRRYRVDKHIAMDANEVLRVENAVLILSGSIDNL